MRVRELEKLFKSEDTLEEVLDKCKEDFELIDYNANTVLKMNLSSNPEEVKKTLNELSGASMNLRPILAIAKTIKKNKELVKYHNLKTDIVNNGKKFVSASVEREASAYVKSYRRVRNIIEAYVESADKGISSLQSILKELITEKNSEKE